MTSRTLRIVVTDIEAEWLVPVTASISWVDYQLVLKLISSRTRHGVQEFLRRNNIPVTEFVDEKELIVDPRELQEVSIKESNITTKELLERLNDDEY
jgi:hypothetical protein